MEYFALFSYCFFIYTKFAYYTLLELGCSSATKVSVVSYFVYIGIVELVVYVCNLRNTGELIASMVASIPLCYLFLYDRLKRHVGEKADFIAFAVELVFSLAMLLVFLYLVFNRDYKFR